MSNFMQFHIGYISELIYKNGKPTLHAKVRIPSIHGSSELNGLKNSDLPIASPLVFPGFELNPEEVEKIIESVNKVYVIFEGGNLNKPIYFGVKVNADLYDVPIKSKLINVYPSYLDLPTNGSQYQLYLTSNNSALYYFEDGEYHQLYAGTSYVPDILIGTVTVFTTVGPASGLRDIDGIQLVENDKVLIVGDALLTDGVYSVKPSTWEFWKSIEDNQVISIDSGLSYGGTMLKYKNTGVVEVVKKSEQTKWSSI